MKKNKLLFCVCGLLMCVVFPPTSFVFAKMSNDPDVSQWGYTDTGVFDAWDFTTGSSDVVVAVLDNGFDYLHPDLADNVWTNTDEIPNNQLDDDQNGYVDDVYGWNFADNNNNPRPDVLLLNEAQREENNFSHGTFVAGIIGAVGNNGRDGAGINWKVKLMNVKTVGNDGEGDINQLGSAIRYAVDNGADILNISLVTPTDFEDVHRAVDYAYEHNVLIVAASGNMLQDLNMFPAYPVCFDTAQFQKIIGVSAISKDHRHAIFSNIGSSCIDITAPGVDINSTVFFSPENQLNEEYHKGWNGTSFSTPMVSGAAALIKSIQPTWTAQDIMNALKTSVQHTPNQDEVEYANLFGAGLLQVGKAIKFSFGKLPMRQQMRIMAGKQTQADGMSIVAPIQGFMEGRLFADEGRDPTIIPTLQGIDAIGQFMDLDRKQYYAVARSSDKNSQITIYSDQWIKQKQWDIPNMMHVDLAVGDVVGSRELEIVAVPRTMNKELVSIYSLNGELLYSSQISNAHTGVGLSLSKHVSDTKNDIVLLYRQKNKIILEKRNGSLDILKTITPKISFGSTLTTGDVNSDGENEYIVGAGSKEKPHVAIVSEDGSVLKQFAAYVSSFRGGIDVSSFDYNDDGISDIVTSPLSGNQPIAVFDEKGELGRWWAFGEKNLGRIMVLPSSR